MATRASSKRISRLRSREPSVKVSPEKKLKPKRVITTNKNLKKINVSARGKSLRVSKGNVSLRNSRTPLTRLRPRRNRKNYCEDSKLLQQYIQPKQQDSVVIVEKLDGEDDKKVPVYKAMKPSEKSSEDKTDIYDFKFDIDDTREKATKKRKTKKYVNKGKTKVTKKMTRRKVPARSKTTDHQVIKSPEPEANLSMEVAQSNPLKFATATKSTKKEIVKKIEMLEINTDIQTPEVNKDIEEEIEPPRIDAEDIQTIETSTEDIVEKLETPRADTNIQSVEKTTLPGRTFAKQIKKESTNKPKVISIENANNITVTKSPPSSSKDPWPFRPKNIFNNKTSLKEHNSTLKCSLLTKTLSPILKMVNTLDLGSPWRPPTLLFSHTKHFIQSTPYKKFETNKEINKKSMETNKENMEMNKENMTMDKENIENEKENIENDKENMDMNKENKGRRDKERKQKAIDLRKKRKLPISENQAPKKVRAAVASKSIVQPAPARVSLGEIKNLLQKPNVNGDNKQTRDQAHTEVDKSLSGVDQTNKQLLDILNFSDTFDVLSETEKLSNIGNDAPLFMDLEPSHFSKPPQHSYRRKRAVKFDFSGDSGEEEKENVKHYTKKKKLTKSEKENEKRINEWVKTVNTTFQEIEEYDLVIE